MRKKELENKVIFLQRDIERVRDGLREMSRTRLTRDTNTYGLQTTTNTRINELELTVKQLTNILIKAGILDTLSMHDAVEVNGTKYNLNRVH
jgi:hypothetical protein